MSPLLLLFYLSISIDDLQIFCRTQVGVHGDASGHWLLLKNLCLFVAAALKLTEPLKDGAGRKRCGYDNYTENRNSLLAVIAFAYSPSKIRFRLEF